MSEKATLLSSIPPVKKAETNDDGRLKLLSSEPAKKEAPKVSLLSQTRSSETAKPATTQEAPVSLISKTTSNDSSETALKPILPTVPTATDATDATTASVEAVETVPSEAVAEEAPSVSIFQYVTYASFVLNFLLAGAAAVILFKKASTLIEERFAISTKALALASVLILLHGLFATYLYNSHLNDAVSAAPLFATMFLWVFVGPFVGFITRNLLARKDKPNRKAAFIDAGIYGMIFFFAAFGVSSGIKTNAALLSSIMAGFLMIVPIARSLTAFNVAKARHKELNEPSDQILIYGLLFIPALLPVLSFAYVCGLSASLTLFLINFLTFDFVLVVGLAMIASADEMVPESAQVEEVNEVPEPTAPVKEAVAPAPAAVEAPEPEAPAPATAKEVAQPEAPTEPAVAAGNPDDPIIQFLNSEEADEKPAASDKPAAKSTPRTLPPRKPGRPGVTPPKKPGAAAKAAPNAPAKVKAPAKPKKRF